MMVNSSRQALVYFISFTSFALAAVTSVYVDDADVTGIAAPTYLPSPSNWDQGNDCQDCGAKPNPTLAHDGTWHDATFSPNSTVYQSFEFTFEGSGLYIYFITVNSLFTSIVTTELNIILDGELSNTFSFIGAENNDYQYNVTVYANDSLPYGQHTAHVMPIDNSVNAMLMLFDYLMYISDTDASSTPIVTTPTSSALVASTTGFVSLSTSASGIPLTSGASSVVTTFTEDGVTITSMVLQSPSSSPTPTLTESSSSSPGSNIRAIIGGAVTGAGAIVAIISLLCYRWYKSHATRRHSTSGTSMVEPFIMSHSVPPATSEDTSLPREQTAVRSPRTEVGWKTTMQPSNTSSSVAPFFDSGVPSGENVETMEQVESERDEVAGPLPSSSGASAGGTTEILQQVGLLRDEVAHLRHLQSRGWNIAELHSEPPPEYS